MTRRKTPPETSVEEVPSKEEIQLVIFVFPDLVVLVDLYNPGDRNSE